MLCFMQVKQINYVALACQRDGISRYVRSFPKGALSFGSFGDYNLPFVYSTNRKIIWFQDV
jgi:hypothetical protein